MGNLISDLIDLLSSMNEVRISLLIKRREVRLMGLCY